MRSIINSGLRLLTLLQNAPCKRATNQYTYSRWLFLRGMGIIYLLAFISLWWQIDGLIGSEGILPAQEYLQQITAQTGTERYFKLPTLAWFSSSDLFLHLLCAGGVLFSILLFLNYAPTLSLLLLWMFYLSLTTISQIFLGYQWDHLLLEAGFLSIFLATWNWPSCKTSPKRIPAVLLGLFGLLLFKLLFSSGIAKLNSGDPTWLNFTALNFHYETQPLPTLFGWIIHQFPPWFDKLSVGLMYLVELLVPFFFFVPHQRGRKVAFGSVTGLMVLIMLTGNYCFFNLLTINLAILLLNDQTIRQWWPSKWLPDLTGNHVQPASTKFSVIYIYGGFYLLICSFQLLSLFITPKDRPLTLVHSKKELPIIIQKIQTPTLWASRNFRSINSYGLFANMMTKRPEIIIQGSRNGRNWKNYEFQWKPDDPQVTPGWVQPHQPRLDWQMWFAALRNYKQSRWIIAFMVRLLEDKQPVLNLLEQNPFPDKPPRYIRAVRYQYKFTDWSTLWETGRWWSRQRLGLYCPAFSLQQVRQSR